MHAVIQIKLESLAAEEPASFDILDEPYIRALFPFGNRSFSQVAGNASDLYWSTSYVVTLMEEDKAAYSEA